MPLTGRIDVAADVATCCQSRISSEPIWLQEAGQAAPAWQESRGGDKLKEISMVFSVLSDQDKESDFEESFNFSFQQKRGNHRERFDDLSRSSDSLIISARQGNREKRTFVFNADHDDDENESDFAEDESESDSVSSHLHQCRGADGSCRQPEKRFIIEEYIEQFDQRSAWSRHGYWREFMLEKKSRKTEFLNNSNFLHIFLDNNGNREFPQIDKVLEIWPNFP